MLEICDGEVDEKLIESSSAPRPPGGSVPPFEQIFDIQNVSGVNSLLVHSNVECSSKKTVGTWLISCKALGRCRIEDSKKHSSINQDKLIRPKSLSFHQTDQHQAKQCDEKCTSWSLLECDILSHAF